MIAQECPPTPYEAWLRRGGPRRKPVVRSTTVTGGDSVAAMTTVGNDAFASFVRRIVRAYVRRIADGDVAALADLAALGVELEAATGDAARALNAQGYSWPDIGRATGRDRSNAFRAWGKK